MFKSLINSNLLVYFVVWSIRCFESHLFNAVDLFKAAMCYLFFLFINDKMISTRKSKKIKKNTNKFTFQTMSLPKWNLVAFFFILH